MTDPAFDLNRIQRWMQSVITHPDGVAEGMHSASARQQIDVPPAEVDRVIRPSSRQTSLERLQVYANAYYARLLECLRSEYPALVRAVGEKVFNGFAFGYLQRYPSTSYTLARLGARFPQYLKETRPGRGDAPDWTDFIIDLATLERTYAEVFDGPGYENDTLLSADALLGIDQDRWPQAHLVPVPCLRLMSLRYPVHEYATAVRGGEAPAIPPARPCWLAVSRRDYVVRRRPLSEPQFALLTALVEGGAIGEAIAATVESTGVSIEELAGLLERWFRDWTAAGFFQRVELAGEADG